MTPRITKVTFLPSYYSSGKPAVHVVVNGLRRVKHLSVVAQAGDFWDWIEPGQRKCVYRSRNPDPKVIDYPPHIPKSMRQKIHQYLIKGMLMHGTADDPVVLYSETT